MEVDMAGTVKDLIYRLIYAGKLLKEEKPLIK
jgi:hypothetical protein